MSKYISLDLLEIILFFFSIVIKGKTGLKHYYYFTDSYNVDIFMFYSSHKSYNIHIQ
jgi:hypothetical protein